MGAMPVITGPVTFPGEFTPLSGTTEAARPELAGLVLHDALQGIELFGIGPPVAVQIQLRVVRSDITGLLDFYYRILTGTSPLGTRADTVTIWLPPPTGITVTYADFRPDGLGTTAPDKFIYGAPGQQIHLYLQQRRPCRYQHALLLRLHQRAGLLRHRRRSWRCGTSWNGNYREGSGSTR